MNRSRVRTCWIRNAAPANLALPASHETIVIKIIKIDAHYEVLQVGLPSNLVCLVA